MRRLAAAMLVGAAVLLGGQVAPARGGDYEPPPLDGLSEDELARFAAGQSRFGEEVGLTDGLGPLYNEASCLACHSSPGPGGSDGSLDHQVLLFGRLGGGAGFDPLTASGGPSRAERSIRTELPKCTLAPDKVPPQANVKSHRQPSPLYGLGLVEAIPDAVILAQVQAGAAADPGEVHGRPNLVGGGVGRFGWKAQAASLEAFVAYSLVEELGVTSPAEPVERVNDSGTLKSCDAGPEPDDDGTRLAALVDFVRFLAPLPAGDSVDEIEHGATVFRRVGCGACHVPSLSTGSNPNPAFSDRQVALFSDLLLHDMGEELADGTIQGQAGPSEWRTAPLWGLSQKERYLHDGRSTSLREVLELHTGEALAARSRLRKRPRRDIDDLVAFLRSL